MHKETEIKLRATPEVLATLRKHPLLANKACGEWRTHSLLNQYYDTQDHQLAQHKVALRLRRDDETYIQTLKSRGQSVAGLSERNEWNWTLAQAELDTQRLDDSCWPQALASLDKGTLAPIFRTDFQRQKLDLRWQQEGETIEVEVALDQGAVICEAGQEPLCELELELRAGPPTALLQLALELAVDVPLMPCDISKAERGYRLHDPHGYSLDLPPLQLSAEQTLDSAIAALGWHLLGNSQRLAEQYRFNRHWTQLQAWVEQLAALRALLSSAGQAIPRASSSALRSQLDALLEDWWPRILGGRQAEQQRQEAAAAFDAELRQPRWGLCSLSLSLWLLQRHWQQQRPARASRQGEAALGRWLRRQLGSEAHSLQLHQYEHQPQLLSPQLPRLERMLVWLQWARHTLDLPDLDRLYGELNKLAELLRLEMSEPLLTQRSEQLHMVCSLPSWKQLMHQ